jgi:hypothetical protein
VKTSSRLAKDHRASTVTILLIAAVLLVAGVSACDGAHTYQLAISSASGGSVVIPGEGTLSYSVGTVVQLMAAADDGYQFRSWTGDVASIGNPNAASTTITMNGHYAIVANFETEGETGSDDGAPIADRP